MDRFVESFRATPDGDLALCLENGVAYQRDMEARAPYDAAYFDKCAGYEDKEIAIRINLGRIDLVRRHYGDGSVLDIGVGSGEFIKKRGGQTYGFDINPRAKEWLLSEGLWSEVSLHHRAFTFWDVLEHVPEPEGYFRHMGNGTFLFASIPVFKDLTRIRESKHYRPGEHLYYWTAEGFEAWLNRHGFVRLETTDYETKAGRESILSFAFRRVL